MSLESLREEVDRIDAELVALLNVRADTALKIGDAKRLAHVDVRCPEREQEVLKGLSSLNEGPLDDAHLRTLFMAIIDMCSDLQGRAAGAVPEGGTPSHPPS